WAATLTGIAAFTTMLWPYAYIGMETNQALFVFLAGFLALAPRPRITRRVWIGFAVSAGFAIGLKFSGMVLIPAVALLIFALHRRQLAMGVQPQRLLRRTLCIVLIAGALYGVAVFTALFSPLWAGDAIRTTEGWTVPPLQALLNAFSFFFSTNKGLLMYCPVTLLSLVWIPKAWREDPFVTGFAVLVLGGLVAGFAPMYFFTEETWGPRYLLTAVAPLIMLLGLVVRSAALRWNKTVPLLVLAFWGLFVSFLGIFFSYQHLYAAGVALMGPSLTVERFQHDS